MNREKSKLALIIPLTIAMGVMLAPESLVTMGNGVGSVGGFFVAFMFLAMLAHFLTVLSYGELSGFHSGVEETSVLREAFGFLPAVLLPLSSKAMFLICASTGILTTAGYVFNEVFVYWFPNLGFSFCLLCLLLVINLFGRKVATAAQIIFVSVAVLGLAFLVLVGLLGLGNAPKVVKAASPPSLDFVRVTLVGLFLFIGHELAARAQVDKEEDRRSLTLPLLWAVGLIGIIMAAWGLVSLEFVSMKRLADSSIPHMIAAREILGQRGRIIMGTVVIAGTLSAVNGLLFAVSRMLGSMARSGLLPSFLAGKPERASAGLILLASGIAAMMGLGMAGESVLEIYTRASLLFWLLSYAAVHLAVFILIRGYEGQSAKSLRSLAVSVLGCFAMLTGFVGLLWTDPESTQLVKCMLTVFGMLSICTLAWIGLKRRQLPSVFMKIG